MRCTSPTPVSTSISRTSKSLRAPTAPSTVCRAPVLRCTSKPISTRRSITCWICSSLADSCIATIIISQFSVVHFNIEFRLALGRFCFGLNFFFLQRAHHVNNALKNMLQLMPGQRPAIQGAPILKNLLLPFPFLVCQLLLPLHPTHLRSTTSPLY